MAWKGRRECGWLRPVSATAARRHASCLHLAGVANLSVVHVFHAFSGATYYLLPAYNNARLRCMHACNTSGGLVRSCDRSSGPVPIVVAGWHPPCKSCNMLKSSCCLEMRGKQLRHSKRIAGMHIGRWCAHLPLLQVLLYLYAELNNVVSAVVCRKPRLGRGATRMTPTSFLVQS